MEEINKIIEEKINFAIYYYDNVIEPLKDVCSKLASEKVIIKESKHEIINGHSVITPAIIRNKYTREEIYKIITGMMNKNELIYFATKIFKIYEKEGNNFYIDVFLILKTTKQELIEYIKRQYDIYFRNEERRLKNIEKKERYKIKYNKYK